MGVSRAGNAAYFVYRLDVVVDESTSPKEMRNEIRSLCKCSEGLHKSVEGPGEENEDSPMVAFRISACVFGV